jgi:hypothetical protein
MFFAIVIRFKHFFAYCFVTHFRLHFLLFYAREVKDKSAHGDWWYDTMQHVCLVKGISLLSAKS